MYIKIQYLGFYESVKKETECQDLSIYLPMRVRGNTYTCINMK